MSLIGGVKDYNNVNLNDLDKVNPEGIQVKGKITFEIKDKNGNIIKKWTQPSRSFTYNYALMIYGLLFQATVGLTDIYANTDVLHFASGGTININAGSGDDGFGIVVGSGSRTINTSVLYQLILPISNGSGSGQLNYQAMKNDYPLNSGIQSYFKFSREFINNSGETITISEVGVIASLLGWGQSLEVLALIIYDLPSSAINLTNGSSLTITYEYIVEA